MTTQAENVANLTEALATSNEEMGKAAFLALLTGFLENQQKQTDAMLRLASAMEQQVEILTATVAK